MYYREYLFVQKLYIIMGKKTSKLFPDDIQMPNRMIVER